MRTLGSAGMNASSTIGSLSSYADDTVSRASWRPASCGATGCAPATTAAGAAVDAIDAIAATLPAAAAAAAPATAAVVVDPSLDRTPSSVAHCAVLASIERSVS
ncbi:hypothetical protein [Burkholderia sp. Nafp2/4-1b]|uniref:hypothetical protein n=1 Tax=Burkholderia sp. Nafp2/4-1b TaxID=2116686 RepID=UPI001F09D479|nr:hypothetical protein [Burkholderia sp. Nafp2/4-1b]